MAGAGASTLDLWRQGSILSPELAVRLNLVAPGQTELHAVVVVSHDCDIANTRPGAEPEVEVIVARCIPGANGNFTVGKSPRTLHLEWTHAEGDQILELQAREKRHVPKSEFEGGNLPDSNYRLSVAGLQVLRHWLALRYHRSAFPNAFNDLLRNSKKSIQVLLEPHDQLSAVQIVLNTMDELPVGGSGQYEVDIFLTFLPGDDPLEAQDTMDGVALALEKLLAERFFDDELKVWKGIKVKGCTAISEADLRVSEARQMQQLYLDHLSLKSDPPGSSLVGPFGRL